LAVFYFDGIRPFLFAAKLHWHNSASADGLRFVVPVKTLHGGFNRKYFPGQPGVTYW